VERDRGTGAQRGEGGFTIVEMVVAMTIMALSMMALATTQYSSLKALGASRQRSAFIELGNGYMEQMRSLPADQVGVSSTDPGWTSGTAYPGGQHEGLPAVVLVAATPPPPPAVEVVTTTEVKGIVVPYTVRRWITRDPAGGTSDDLRRLEVEIEWLENRRSLRTVSTTSVWYPGGLGTDPAANNVPVITSAAAAPAAGSVSTVFAFDVAAYDPDADGISVNWQFGDGATGNGSSTSHQYTSSGTYSVVVRVTDTRGGVATRTFDVTVGALTNSAPVAQFVITSADNGPAPFTVNVDGSGSSDADGDALSYEWTWGDGTTGTGVSAGHVYSAAGTYPVTLKVTDTSGATSTSSPQTVTVTGGCVVYGASFKNPGTNAVANDIAVVSSKNSKPVNSQFVFTARTNTSCSQVTWSLQTSSSSQRYEVTGTLSSLAGGEKVFTLTDSIPNNHQFPLGAMLTGFATASGSSYAFAFAAHV
jgi:PKD repeat protein